MSLPPRCRQWGVHAKEMRGHQCPGRQADLELLGGKRKQQGADPHSSQSHAFIFINSPTDTFVTTVPVGPVGPLSRGGVGIVRVTIT